MSGSQRLVAPRYPAYDPDHPQQLLHAGYTAGYYILPRPPGRLVRAAPPLPLFVQGGAMSADGPRRLIVQGLCSRLGATHVAAVLVGRHTPSFRQFASVPVWMVSPVPPGPELSWTASTLPYVRSTPLAAGAAPELRLAALWIELGDVDAWRDTLRRCPPTLPVIISGPDGLACARSFAQLAPWL